MDLIFSPLTVSMLVVLAVVTVSLAFRPNPSTQAVKARMETYLVREELEDPTAALRDLQGSFIHRAIMPMMRRIFQAIGQMASPATLEGINKLLTAAGRPGNLTPADFLGFCILLAALGVAVGFLYGHAIANGDMAMLLVPPVVGAAIGFMGPRYWLMSKGTRRKDLVQRNLPDALDMLTVCVEAGLAFEASMQRVSERWSGPLSEEFARVVAEIRLGVPRSQALRRMAQRCDTADVSSFVAVLVQADTMGTSIAQVIHSQADQIRMLRRQRAEEKANKAPIKVLLPLVLFIFPALFVVILGPGIPMILEALGSAGGK